MYCGGEHPEQTVLCPAPTYVYSNSTPDIRLPTPVASPEIIAAVCFLVKEKKLRSSKEKSELTSGVMLGHLGGNDLAEELPSKDQMRLY